MLIVAVDFASSWLFYLTVCRTAHNIALYWIFGDDNLIPKSSLKDGTILSVVRGSQSLTWWHLFPTCAPTLVMPGNIGQAQKTTDGFSSMPQHFSCGRKYGVIQQPLLCTRNENIKFVVMNTFLLPIIPYQILNITEQPTDTDDVSASLVFWKEQSRGIKRLGFAVLPILPFGKCYSPAEYQGLLRPVSMLVIHCPPQFSRHSNMKLKKNTPLCDNILHPLRGTCLLPLF